MTKTHERSPPVIWHNRPPSVHISCLYPEILAIIFKYLDVEGKGRAARVCTSWRDACYHKSVWTGVEAKIHVNLIHVNAKYGSSGDTLYASLVKRGIKRVQVLSVKKSSTKLHESLHEVIHKVSNLESLNLSGCYNLIDNWILNGVRGPINTLVELNLSMCKPITDACLCKIAHHIKCLETLDLGGCSNVTNNGLLSLSLGLNNLKFLSLRSSNHVSDTGIGHLCHTTPETSHLKSTSPLKHLNLQDCQKITDDALRHISVHMINIESINLSFCAGITDFGLKYLSVMSSLRELNLRSCDNVTNTGIINLNEGRKDHDIVRDLKDLHVLDISFNKDRIGDHALLHVSQKLVNLKSLSLTASICITDEGLTRISKSLNSLKSLNIGQCNKITDKGLNAIADHLSNLETIDLYGNTLITTVGIEKIMQLPNLRVLNLDLWQKQQIIL